MAFRLCAKIKPARIDSQSLLSFDTRRIAALRKPGYKENAALNSCKNVKTQDDICSRYES